MRRILAFLFFLWPLSGSAKTIAITQIVEHPALNAVVSGFKTALKKKYGEKNLVFIETTAQGNRTLAAQIAHKFLSDDPDLILAVSTPSAQSMRQALKNTIPLLFSAITDPVAARLVQNPKGKENVSGVTDRPPFKDQIDFMKKILPFMTKIGILYNPGEDNSAASLTLLRPLLKDKGIEIILAPLAKTSDAPSTARSLIGRVDALYIPNDNTVVSSLESILKVCDEAKLPVFAADILLVEKGVLGMIGFDYSSIGEQTGAMAIRTLEGEPLSSIPVENPKILKTYVNKTVAKKLNIHIPEDVLKKADQIF